MDNGKDWIRKILKITHKSKTNLTEGKSCKHYFSCIKVSILFSTKSRFGFCVEAKRKVKECGDTQQHASSTILCGMNE